MMKRSVGALGILGLVWAVALPAAHAGVLWQPDLSKGNPLQGVNGIYRQGVSGTDGDRSTATDVGTAPFLIDTDSTSRKNLWLDGGASDNVSLGDGYSDIDGSKNASGDVSAPFMLLTGDAAKWADVQITTKMDFWDQNTGAAGLVLRAAAKTKFSDPDSFYMFQLTTGNSNVLDSMARDGITQPNDTTKNPDGSDEGYTLRVLKVVKGKWTMLAEINQDKTSIHIPQINRLGIDHDVKKGADDGNQDEDLLVGGYFRFAAKGDTLTGFVSMDGKTFTQILQAHDSDLKAGLAGFHHYDHRPLFKEILVEDAP
jgi:hypothetical protein